MLTKFTKFIFKRSGMLFPHITRHVKRKIMLAVFNNINIACFQQKCTVCGRLLSHCKQTLEGTISSVRRAAFNSVANYWYFVGWCGYNGTLVRLLDERGVSEQIDPRVLNTISGLACSMISSAIAASSINSLAAYRRLQHTGLCNQMLIG